MDFVFVWVTILSGPKAHEVGGAEVRLLTGARRQFFQIESHGSDNERLSSVAACYQGVESSPNGTFRNTKRGGGGLLLMEEQ